MTKMEIVQEYRLSADKAKQIGILADLNGVKPEEIVRILREAGQTLPEGFGEKKIYHKTCAICGRQFDSIQRNAKFCKDCQQKGTKQETGASPRPTDADQSAERIAAAPAGPRNDEGGERIAAAPAGHRNDEEEKAIHPRRSEEADKADVGIRKTPPVTPADTDQSGKPSDIWAMPEAWDFWHDAFRWKMGFIEFVEAMKGLGITVDGLERDDG